MWERLLAAGLIVLALAAIALSLAEIMHAFGD